MTTTRRFEAWALKCLPSSVRKRLHRASTENRSILQGMVWVATFLFFAKAIAAGKEMLVAYRYGVSAVVDGYLLVFNLAQWPSSIFASVTSVVLIPYLVKLQKQKPVEANEVQVELLPIAFLVGTVISLVFGLIMWWMVGQSDLGLTDEGQAAALTALPWVAPSIALAFMGTVLSNWLMSQRRHANTLLDAAPAAVIALCLLIWPMASGKPWNVLPLAVGTLIGFLFQTFLLSRFCKQNIHFASLGAISQHWPVLRRAFSIMLLAQVVMTSTGMLDQFFAVRMGEGVLTSYSYAQRIMALVLGLTALVVGRAMLPVFAGVGDIHASFDLAVRWSWRFAAFGLLSLLVLIYIAEGLVFLFFQRGAFTASDTHDVAQILRILALQLPFYLFNIVLVQWLSAVGKAAWLLMTAVVSFLVKLLGALVWFDLGARGLAASTALMYGASAIVIYGTVRRLLR